MLGPVLEMPVSIRVPPARHFTRLAVFGTFEPRRTPLGLCTYQCTQIKAPSVSGHQPQIGTQIVLTRIFRYTPIESEKLIFNSHLTAGATKTLSTCPHVRRAPPSAVTRPD